MPTNCPLRKTIVVSAKSLALILILTTIVYLLADSCFDAERWLLRQKSATICLINGKKQTVLMNGCDTCA